MSLDTDIVETLDIAQEVYVIDPEEVKSPQLITGVAKRKFREDHDVESCRSSKLFGYSGFYVVVVTENLFRDWKDGAAIRAIRDNEQVVDDYLQTDDPAAFRRLVDEAQDAAGVTNDEIPDRVERLLERFDNGK